MNPNLIDTIEELRNARIEYAKTWQWNRKKASSDYMATQMTIESTNDKVGYLESLLKVQLMEGNE